MGVGFDFHAPSRVQKSTDDDHGGGGAGDGKELAVDTGYLFPVFGAGEIDAGADDLLDGGAGLFEGAGDDGEDLVGLGGGIGIIGTDGTGSGDVDMGADADGAGEADDGFVGGGAWDVLAFAHAVLDAGGTDCDRELMRWGCRRRERLGHQLWGAIWVFAGIVGVSFDSKGYA